MKWLNAVTLLLTVIGGLNWGLVAIGGYNMDLVARLLGGSGGAAARVVYALVGLSALWQILPLARTFRIDETAAEAAPVGR